MNRLTVACVATGAADAQRDGVKVCGLPLGRPGMAGLACLFALAPEQALGLQFARAAPVKSGPAVRDFVFESRLSSPSLNRGTWLGRKYVEARGWAALMPPYVGCVLVCSSCAVLVTRVPPSLFS